MFEYIIGLLALLEAYKGLRFFFIRRRIKGPVKIMKGFRPFSRHRGKKVALLIHGFTSSPGEFRKLGDLLAKNDLSVHAPLLPGHGTSPERLSLVKYVEWIEFLENEIAMLEQKYEEIYLIGNSFGGNLSLIMATKSKKIKGIVTLSVPITFRHEKIGKYFIFPIVKRIKLFQRKSKETIKFIEKQGGSYDSVPIKSINQMLKVIKLSKDVLKDISVPILVMQTEKDTVVSEESSNYIIKNVGSRKKRVFTVPESYHVFISDKHAGLANREVLKFVQRGE
tara:strand:- start:1807 stop:2646 length:840 start_codon:yes stop_codon:yes gene_type:complete